MIKNIVTCLVAVFVISACSIGSKSPTASFTADVDGALLRVNASASRAIDGTIASYDWDFGDDSTGSGVDAEHTYEAAGSYTVKLTVTDDKGNKGTAEESVTIAELPGGTIVGRVIDENSNLVPNVQVTYGDRSVVSNEQGFFTFADVPVGERLLDFTASNYAMTQVKVDVSSEQSTFTQVRMLSAQTFSIDSTSDQVIESDGAKLEFTADSFVDATGNAFTGQANVTVAVLDPSIDNELATFPTMEAQATDGSEGFLESFGAVNFSVSDQDGNTLSFAANKTATIQIPMPTSANVPANIPLWKFDTDLGIWIEQSNMASNSNQLTTLQTDDVFVAVVDEPAWWNADIIYESTCLKGRIIDIDSQPVEQASINTRGVDYYGLSNTYSDANGEFISVVRTSSQVKIDVVTSGQVSFADATYTTGSVAGDDNCLDVGDITVEAAKLAVILTWGQNPSDLDSHFWGPNETDDSRFHVSYSNKGSLSSAPFASLDTDDTTSYGPEIITLTKVIDRDGSPYRYSVYNYSGGGDQVLSNSEAVVQVLVDGQVRETYTVPAGEGRWWNVFEYSDGEITTINTIAQNSSEASSALGVQAIMTPKN